MLDKSQREYLVAELILSLIHGDPKPSPDHAIWFKDGQFTNFRKANLRWVNRKNLAALARTSRSG